MRTDFCRERTSIPEHRALYNRPRYQTGRLLSVLEPSSQEAMAWQTGVQNGYYENNAGRCVPHYYYLKPWEGLNTRARPDFQVKDPLKKADVQVDLVEVKVEPSKARSADIKEDRSEWKSKSPSVK
jgi:hypothetical protein